MDLDLVELIPPMNNAAAVVEVEVASGGVVQRAAGGEIGNDVEVATGGDGREVAFRCARYMFVVGADIGGVVLEDVVDMADGGRSRRVGR